MVPKRGARMQPVGVGGSGLPTGEWTSDLPLIACVCTCHFPNKKNKENKKQETFALVKRRRVAEFYRANKCRRLNGVMPFYTSVFWSCFLFSFMLHCPRKKKTRYNNKA